MNEIIYTIAQTANQSSFFMDHFDSIITVIVTILGFIITYFMTKKNFKDEVMKNKLAINANIIKDLPYEVCLLMDKLLHNKQSEIIIDEYSNLFSKILSYGSRDAVSIVIQMQQLCYVNSCENDKGKMYEMLGCYALLITQIKYDLTSEIISPESWFEMKCNDYMLLKNDIKLAINNIITKLELNTSFIVK